MYRCMILLGFYQREVKEGMVLHTCHFQPVPGITITLNVQTCLLYIFHRKCIGQNFALNEGRVVIGRILSKYIANYLAYLVVTYSS